MNIIQIYSESNVLIGIIMHSIDPIYKYLP